MPKRDEAPVGAPCWVDLMTSDTDTVRPFYCELFGWTIDDPGPDYGGYVNFQKDGVPIGGCMQNSPDMGAADGWSVYLASEDAEKTVAVATAEDGGVVVPAMPVMELGSMAVVTDPGQAAIGVWQPGLHKGFGVWAEPGTPAWFELQTRDYDASVRFYEEVFGWDAHTVSDTPEFRYTTLGEGEGQLAGIMDGSAYLPEGEPAEWSVYFAVEDTDAALARVVELGGTITVPAEDSPYGRLAQAADPAGARFKLVDGS